MRLLPSDRLQRSAVLTSVLALTSVYFAYTYICAPRAARAETLRLRLAELQGSVRPPGPEAPLDQAELERRLKVHEAHLAQLEELIPSSEEVASLLEAVSVEERIAGVEVIMLRPETPEAGEPYDRRSYEVAVKGNYHAIGSFLTAVGSLERIMAPADLTADRAPPDGTGHQGSAHDVLARFRVRTYVVLPAPSADGAQDASRGNAMSESLDPAARVSGGLSLRRELFTYMSANRRDPFSPPGALVTGNPMVGGVRLVGIIHHPDTRLSVVLVEVGLRSGEDGEGAPTEEALSTGVRLRVGDSVGGNRVVEIHPNHVVVEIASPNGVNRRVLETSSGERGANR